MRSIKIILIIIVQFSSVFLSSFLFSQGGIQKEVRVVKPYTPTLSEANKISLLPEFNDTLRVNPNFGYVIFPKRFETDYKIDPIKPAKMVGMPIKKLYKSQLELGFGNYMTPYIELNINQLRAKTTQLGFYFNHQSSSGNIKLENNKKVDAAYSDNIMKLYGKKIFSASVIEGDLSAGYNSVLYYGFDTKAKPDTILLKKDNIQKIYTANAGIKFYSINADSFHLNHKTILNYGLVSDFFKNTENGIDFSTSLNKRINTQVIGGDLRIRYFGRTGGIDSSAFSVVDVSPWYAKSSSEWKFLLGFNVNYDQSLGGPVKLYPKLSFEFNIVPEVLIPYMGINGYREVNNYSKVLFENPFLLPGTRISNTNHTLVLFAGLKGRYSNKMAFNLKASFESVDSMYFYINDSTNVLRNKFAAVYDNGTVLNLSGEVSWHQSDNLEFLLKANYYKYELDMLNYPWHKPSMEIALSSNYNMRDKILLGADVFYTGRRFAQGATDIPKELNGYLDANLSVEYRYTKLLSFFLRFNNLTASKYEIWNQYPAQRFQFLAGFSYAL
jgi:hypothetical protein